MTSIEICALYFGDDPNGVLEYFDSQVMRSLGIYVMSVEGGAETFGGPLRWDLRFQTDTKDGFKKLTDECDKLGLSITSVNMNNPPPIVGHSLYGGPPQVSYVTAPADKIALTAEEFSNLGEQQSEWLIEQLKYISPLPLLEGVIEESPKKKNPPTDTGRHFDMDFDDSDLT